LKADRFPFTPPKKNMALKIDLGEIAALTEPRSGLVGETNTVKVKPLVASPSAALKGTLSAQ